MGKKNDNTLVKNASFLMIAALISKIIGMLYKSPLSNTLGNSSMGLFNYAQNVYFILLMIASFSIPQAVSKIMAEKLAFKRYRDAQKVFHCALLYVVVMGPARTARPTAQGMEINILIQVARSILSLAPSMSLFAYCAETSGIMEVGAVLASVSGILINVI